MEMAQLAYNKPYAEFAKRGLANGFRSAMVLYLANGEKWEKAIEDFIVWSVKYDLWCKMRFFGNQMQEAIDADNRSVCHTPGVSNLLLYVHDTFDKAEIQESVGSWHQDEACRPPVQLEEAWLHREERGRYLHQDGPFHRQVRALRNAWNGSVRLIKRLAHARFCGITRMFPENSEAMFYTLIRAEAPSPGHRPVILAVTPSP